MIFGVSCQSNQNKTSNISSAKEPILPERIIPKDIPKISENLNNANKNLIAFKNPKAIKEQQKFISQDNHIGELKVVIAGLKNIEKMSPISLVNLNKLALTPKVGVYNLNKFKTNVKANDSGDQYLHLKNGQYSLDIEPDSGTYENLIINNSGIGVVNKDGSIFRVGDKINILKKNYPKEFEKSKSIKIRNDVVLSTLISLTEFIGKKSDVFIYIHHINGIITEIGTWEQY